jgi:hypothetical protein
LKNAPGQQPWGESDNSFTSQPRLYVVSIHAIDWRRKNYNKTMTAKSTRSELCRAAARKRWENHTQISFRTIRVREDVLAALQAQPGKSLSDKISRLIAAVG